MGSAEGSDGACVSHETGPPISSKSVRQQSIYQRWSMVVAVVEEAAVAEEVSLVEG